MKWEKPACNICKGNSFKKILTDIITWEHPGKFNIVKCNSCGLLFLSPRPVSNEIIKFYPKKSYWGKDITSSEGQNKYREDGEKAYAPLYSLILSHKKEGKILDIGAGTGLFLAKFADKKWQVDGIEFSKDAVAYAKKTYAITLKTGDFLDYKFLEKSFDVVTLNNSLEHLYDPLGTLKQIYKILKDDGILLITVPNIESIGMKIFSANWYPLQPPRHLYHFSPSTISAALEKTGFSITEIKHSYWVHNYYSLFESFRFFFSPRFRTKNYSGNSSNIYKKNYPIKEIGKVFGRIFAFTFSLIEPFFKKGETIIVYAQKD